MEASRTLDFSWAPLVYDAGTLTIKSKKLVWKGRWKYGR